MSFIKKSLTFFWICSFFVSCRTFPIASKSGYFQSDFRCVAGEGWKSKSKFRAYLKNWKLFKNIYNQKNAEIRQADIVFVGNSLVHAFHDNLLAEEFPKKGVVGRGIGGDMSDLLLKRIQENVLSLNPKTIVIEIGGNDLIHGKCLSYLKSNILQLIEKIRLHNPEIKIIITSVPPTMVPELNTISPIYNAFLSGLPERFSNLYYIDLWAEMMETDAPIIKQDYSFDSVHFNEKGYRIWGKLLRPYL